MITLEKSVFGQIDGKEIYLYTISLLNKITVKITNYGGIVTSILIPDRDGKMEDVVLGFDNIRGYSGTHPYFGCIVGRYANRIAKGKFVLDGKQYQLSMNAGENHLHGGKKGFDKKIWQVNEIRSDDETGIELTTISHDGEEGYPGKLKIRVIYTLTPSMELKIKYFAETDKPTCVNLTHHSYFNLRGAGNGDILDHSLMIHADKYTTTNEQLIPTGELEEVLGTPFDFRQSRLIGQEIDKVEGGYDHNFALITKGDLIKAAVLSESDSGRYMEVYTDQPGMQVYTSNFLDGSIAGKNGKPYHKHYGLCLETQHFPDSPNHPDFASTILRPGDIFQSVTIYKFGTMF